MPICVPFSATAWPLGSSMEAGELGDVFSGDGTMVPLDVMVGGDTMRGVGDVFSLGLFGLGVLR